MKQDLYETLGVGRGASKDEIKRAARKAAKRTHPDAPGGSNEAFYEVQIALKLLTDDRRRDHYDRTGTVDDPPPDQKLALARQEMFRAVVEVLAAIEMRRGYPGAFAVINDCKLNLGMKIDKLRGERAEMTKRAKMQRRLARSFKGKKKKPSLISAMFEANALDIERSYYRIDDQMAVYEGALKLLDNEVFVYESDAPPQPALPRFFTNTSSAA